MSNFLNVLLLYTIPSSPLFFWVWGGGCCSSPSVCVCVCIPCPPYTPLTATNTCLDLPVCPCLPLLSWWAVVSLWCLHVLASGQSASSQGHRGRQRWGKKEENGKTGQFSSFRTFFFYSPMMSASPFSGVIWTRKWRPNELHTLHFLVCFLWILTGSLKTKEVDYLYSSPSLCLWMYPSICIDFRQTCSFYSFS